MKPITLLTDFGTADGYVAAMKGVILSACPNATIADATHEIPPQDVRAGAWALRHYWRLYPEGTIHIAVVDPGVGSNRKPLLIQADDRWLIGPDNGLFSWVFQGARDWRAWAIRPSIRRPGAVGNTFHGRDVFAYAAGLLASSAPLSSIAGRRVKPIAWPWPRVRRASGGLAGEIVHIDRFGNAITNISGEQLAKLGNPRGLEISCRSASCHGLAKYYGEGKTGRLSALVESTGLLELAVRDGNASKEFGLRVGDAVFVKMRENF